jgi:hypothetical protein
VPPLDPNTLPKDVDVLQKIVLDLCEQLQHESAEKDKCRSLLRELLEAQRNRKSEQLSKEQLELFEELWKARQPEEANEEPAAEETKDDEKPSESPVKKRSGRPALGKEPRPGTDCTRSGGSGKALQSLRQRSPSDFRRDQRTLRIYSGAVESDRRCAPEVCLQLHREDGGQATATD